MGTSSEFPSTEHSLLDGHTVTIGNGGMQGPKDKSPASLPQEEYVPLLKARTQGSVINPIQASIGNECTDSSFMAVSSLRLRYSNQGTSLRGL